MRTAPGMESEPCGLDRGLDRRRRRPWIRRKAVRENREERQRQGNPRTQGKRLLRRMRSDGVKINMQVKQSVGVTEGESDLRGDCRKSICRGAGPEDKMQWVLNR